MTTREVLAIAIKLFGLWVLVQFLMIFPAVTVSTLRAFESFRQIEIPALTFVLIIAIQLGIGAAIAYGLFKISNSVLKSAPDHGEMNPSVQAQRFLLQLAGLFFIVSSVVSLPGSLSVFFAPAEIKFDRLLFPSGNLARLGIGLWLIIHPSWWEFWFQKLRGRV